MNIKDTIASDNNMKSQMEIFKEKTKKNFIDFYKIYLPKLIYYNTRIVGSMDIAQDIAIDSFMKSLKKVRDYNPEKAGYSTWLFTISRNECIQYLNKNNKTVSIDKFVDDEGTTIKEFLKDSGDEDMERNNEHNLNIIKGNILIKKIQELKEPYKKVIELREIDNKSYREITILLRKSNVIELDNSFFDKQKTINTITLVDPEKKKPKELVKLFSINKIVDENGNNIKYKIIERDENNLISKLEIPKGKYFIEAEIPFNMSTLKSQIRNGRILLQNMVKEEFDKLDKFHN